MVDAIKLRHSATEYAEAEYQLSRIVSKEVPVDQDDRLMFFAEVEHCEERIRNVSAKVDQVFDLPFRLEKKPTTLTRCFRLRLPSTSL